MERFPHAFPQDYDAIWPLKLGIHADVLQRWLEVDPGLLRRALANHTHRDGYLLALIDHRSDRRYDLDGQPAGTVTEAERAAAARLLDASTHCGQAQAARVRTHAREEKRRQQRAEEQRRREKKAGRKAEHGRRTQEAAARQAEHGRRTQEAAARQVALAAQGIVPESRAERKRWLAQASKTGFRPPAAPEPASDRPPVAPALRPERPPARAAPAPAPSMPHVEFRKKRRMVPPNEQGPS